MKPPFLIAPGSQNVEPIIPQSEGFRPALLASAVALGFLLVAILLAGLRFTTAPPPPARAAARGAGGAWSNREAAARQRLRGEPGEDGARLQLAGALIGRALFEAQQAYPTERATTPDEAAALESRCAQAQWVSPRMAEARQLLDEVARQGRDRPERAVDWARLGGLYRQMGGDAEATACLAPAAREDPSFP
jgi:hypothetical protein